MCKPTFCWALLICACVSLRGADQVTITEFMASNTRTIADEDGLFPDWIEIRNSGTNVVNLFNWSLTDDAGDLTRWRFPATNINPGAFMVIFADGKNRKTPGAPLHTDFNMNAAGEYLALVKPDGVTKATEFAAPFRPQAADVSYGFGTLTSNFTVIATSAPVRVHIPNSSDEELGTNWLTLGFDDQTWISGTNGVGYGATNSFVADYGLAVAPTAPVLYYRLNESSGTTAANIGSGAGMNGTYNAATLGTAGPRPPAWNGFEANNNAPTFNGTSSFVSGPSQLLSGRSSFTMAGWVNFAAAPGARAGLFGQNDVIEFGFSAAGNLQCFTAGGGTLNVAYNPPLNTWVHILVVGDGATLRIFINGVQAGSVSAATASYGSAAFNFNIGGGGVFDATGNFHNGLIDEVVVYHRALTVPEITSLYSAGTNGVGGVSAISFVRTDVNTAMSNVNSSAYIRIPFQVPDPTNISSLTLRMRHDDGFAAYLNGNEVVRVNATNPLTYLSAATTNHSPAVVDSFSFNAAFLQSGTNILAIHGLNRATNDEDFLILAELIAANTTEVSPVPVYFTLPTPGAENGAGVTNPGPAILVPGHTPLVPLDAQDLVVTTRVAKTFFNVASVVMRYRIMFGSELEVSMFDDGAHGDGLPGDGVYGATIPESASTNGQMIRWYFRATDVLGNISRWPLFAVPDSEEYLGTIVNPTNVTSKLPIYHIFAAPGVVQAAPPTSQTGADSQAGGFVSIFYDGEFYDHIEMNLRGNSTAGFNKKAHHLNFNRDHPFRHSGPGGRIRHTAFTAEYPDPSYMRQFLSFWLGGKMGLPEPFYYPVRLQLNGQFYQLASHNDVVGADQMDRFGFDPNGALYKAAGNVLPSQASTGVFEKKTRLTEPNTDYAALANAINESVAVGQRRTNVFEMIDVPEALNYLVTARWVHENDDVWANMSLYRDTDGDKLWRIIPFDMNLSWGAIFYEGGNPTVIEGVQATNDIHKAHPLYGSSQALALSGPGAPNNFNRMYDVFFSVPELREMFLRRMRTLLDTHIKPPGTPPNATEVEQVILARRDLIAEEAIRDRALWGWPAKGGQNNFDPGINLTNGVSQMISNFIYARRSHLYGKHSITNTALAVGITKDQNAGIPLAQASNLVLRIGQIEFNPSSGNQGHEFIQVTNPNSVAVDMSGWRLDGGVDFTFRPGTVLIPNGAIYVTADRNAFKTRTTGPRTNQALFIVGNYQGTLDARGEPVRLFDDGGRLVHTNGYIGNPSLAQQYLRITEIMYHPPTNSGCPFTAEEGEFLELKNIGPTNLNLVGIHFTNGIEFAFSATNAVTNLAPGQVVVLVKNPIAFNCRYGIDHTVAGVYAGTLDNSGERIKLDDSVGEQILDFSYNNSWYPITDGLGFSLVVVNENAAFNTWDEKESWRASGAFNGSAGTNDPAPSVFVPVLVNEVLANSESPALDAIELWNNTTNVADISDWWISDDFFTPQKYRIGTNVTIAPGGYLVFDELVLTQGITGFSFSSKGDEAYIFSGDTNGKLTGYYHGFGYGASEPGVSFGRYIPSDGDEQFVAQAAQTLGTANSLPKVGPIVLSEIMYHPRDILAGTNLLDDSNNEFIELHNITGVDVALFDPAFPTNRWTLTDAVSFTFPTNTIPAGGYLVVVSFDPATNTTVLASFRTRYGIDTNVAIVGPYSGQLDNSDESVKLRKPDRSDTSEVTRVLVEEVHYHDAAPWPFIADGFGASLQRIVAGDFGNDPTNFVAATPSPGSAFVGGSAPIVTQQPNNATVFAAGSSGSSTTYSFGTTNFTAVVSGTGLTYQWSFNGNPIPGETNFTLVLNNIQFNQAGAYSFLAFSPAGSVVSSNATLTVLFPVSFTVSPTNQNVLPGTNVTLASSATGTGLIRYQWRFEGTNILNATNSSYSFVNANLFDHHGNFSVVVEDDLSQTVSSNAFIYVLVRPFVTQHITSQSVLQGQNITFSLVATGAPPLWYRWIRAGGSVAGATTSVPVLTLTNIQASTTLRVAVTNVALPSSGTGAFSPGPAAGNNVQIVMLADADGDGMWDVWETNYFGNISGTNFALVAPGADPDGDGMSNVDEYRSGTIPTNALSVLKIVLTATNANVLQFVAQTNLTYSVQCRTNISTAVWSSISNITLSTNLVRTITVHTATGPVTDERYYRVVTPVAP
ncbi:MAG TPA: lamin tail domain-containing protein [Verrucomicrobiae bacterium]